VRKAVHAQGAEVGRWRLSAARLGSVGYAEINDKRERLI
jgi:hypothetical protein